MTVVATTMRARPGRAMFPRVSTTDPLRMSIAVDRGAVPVSGRVVPEDGAERDFTGWTELFAALRAAVEDDERRE